MGKRIKQFAPGCATRSRLMWSWDPGPEAELLSIPLVHPALPGLCKACQAHEQIVLSDLLISLVAGMTAMQCTNAGDYHRDSRQNKERGTRRKQGIHLWASTQHRKGKGGCLILKIAMWALFLLLLGCITSWGAQGGSSTSPGAQQHGGKRRCSARIRVTAHTKPFARWALITFLRIPLAFVKLIEELVN